MFILHCGVTPNCPNWETEEVCNLVTKVLNPFPQVGDCFIVLMGYYSLNYGWSVVVLAACIPALIMCIVILFLDESPRYLSISDNVSFIDCNSLREIYISLRYIVC